MEGGDVEGVDVEEADVEGADVEGGEVEGGDVEGGDAEGGDVEGGNVEGGDVRRWWWRRRRMRKMRRVRRSNRYDSKRVPTNRGVVGTIHVEGVSDTRFQKLFISLDRVRSGANLGCTMGPPRGPRTQRKSIDLLAPREALEIKELREIPLFRSLHGSLRKSNNLKEIH